MRVRSLPDSWINLLPKERFIPGGDLEGLGLENNPKGAQSDREIGRDLCLGKVLVASLHVIQ